MGKEKDADRFLTRRGGVFQYYRRVPVPAVPFDDRAPFIRISLKTDDHTLARLKRDVLERADDELWAALMASGSPEGAAARYRAAVLRAESLGFAYRSITDLVSTAPMEEILGRFAALSASPAGSADATALLGLVDEPSVTVQQAWEVYRDEIMSPELTGKSSNQRKDWEKVKLRAVNNFIRLNGNISIASVNRTHALKVYNFWKDLIAPDEGPPTHSASSGNRDLGNMRQLFGQYHAHIGKKLDNPFDGLSFSTKGKRRRRRPAFSTDWLTSHFVNAQTQLLHLNEEARAIIFIILETGARPSEACNLDKKTIVLTGEVPHIVIEPREDPDDPREIKTESSIRVVPLVGIALAAARKFPNGFPRYRNNERTLSNTLTKSLRSHGLLETKKHTAYSLRHAFEDRMKAGMIDAEIRKYLMGHTLDRPEYGSTANLLKHVQRDLLRIALPYHPSIV